MKVPGVIVMAILIVLTGCRCVCPGQSKSASYSLSSLSHCLGQMGLAYPFLGHILQKKKKKKKGVLRISIIKTLYQKIPSKTSYGARLCKPWMSHERGGTNRLFCIATLVLHCLLTGYSPSPIPLPLLYSDLEYELLKTSSSYCLQYPALYLGT